MKSVLIITTLVSLVSAQLEIPPTTTCYPQPTVTVAPPKGCKPPKFFCDIACPQSIRLITVPCDCPTDTVTVYKCPTGCSGCGPGYILQKDC